MRPAAKAAYAHFATLWGVTTTVLYPSESHVLPAPPFVRVSMVVNSSVQLTMGGPGNKLFERHASVRVQIFVAVDAGEGQLLDLGQAALNVFEGKSIEVAGEPIAFFKVDFDRKDDEPHLLAGVVEAQCRYQERK